MQGEGGGCWRGGQEGGDGRIVGCRGGGGGRGIIGTGDRGREGWVRRGWGNVWSRVGEGRGFGRRPLGIWEGYDRYPFFCGNFFR